MGYNKPDPYNQPEEFNLRIVGSVDSSSGGYEWELFIVWQHTETGQLYWAADGGCSCNGPGDNFAGMGDLTEASAREIQDELDSWANYTYSDVAAEMADLKLTLANL